MTPMRTIVRKIAIKAVSRGATSVVATVEAKTPAITKKMTATRRVVTIPIISRMAPTNTRVLLLRITPIRRHTPAASPMRQRGTEYLYSNALRKNHVKENTVLKMAIMRQPVRSGIHPQHLV